ncbi:MHS family MFS transporter [Amycolatopsis acidicola]|uniref:Putative proline/betaine transporter n=1 Tax=Amycolatopsis acidicola TaxID=2596893 RepID=A0A5N0VAR3_9PSEU|nr:MFS transporter [Amycolatopsis acidicola]KAA9162618.1 MHS family MFS transporter [Amycolatopsis acidicola]
MPATTVPTTTTTTDLRRVALASLIGTTVEWYDFLVYAAAAGLVFTTQFFPGLEPASALLASFATIGVSFLARPLGGILAGHLGDRIGRRAMLVGTLVLMGGSTTAIGLLPGYATIGVAAPVLLVVLRFLQGISAGGEWGGAALLAVEHAPPGRRGVFGSFPQLGGPFGLVLANLALLTVSASTSKEQFLAWGWRIPFLFSVVLIGAGMVIRAKVAESPVFAELRARRARRGAPLAELVRKHPREVLVATALFVGVNLCGYLLIAFIGSYGTQKLHASSSTMLVVGVTGALEWALWTVLGARWSDRFGRRPLYLVSTIALAAWAFPMFLLLDTGTTAGMLIAVSGLAFGLGTGYGPQAAAYAELFPAAVRYSGASLAYSLGAVLGGGFAPLAAAWLLARTGSSMAVSAYMVAGCVVTFAGILAWRERPAAEREASVGR